MTVESVHTPVTRHVLDSSHDTMLVHTCISTATTLSSASTGFLSTTMVSVSSTVLVCFCTHHITSNHSLNECLDVVASGAECATNDVGSLDSAPSLCTSRRMQTEDTLQTWNIFHGCLIVNNCLSKVTNGLVIGCFCNDFIGSMEHHLAFVHAQRAWSQRSRGLHCPM